MTSPRRPTSLFATPQRINSRPATTHLVDNVNAARTLCDRLIDPPTWRYHGQDDNLPLCTACRKIADKRHPSPAFAPVPSGRLTLEAHQ